MKKIVYSISCLVMILLLSFCIMGCDSTNSSTSVTKNSIKSNSNINIKKEEKEYMTGKHNIKIEVEEYGDITLELDADTAPITVTNFIKLVNEGFYNGLTFHRIIDGFMIQGGDPNGNGTGGSKEKIKGEFLANGVENNISHKRGVISMARSSIMDSASSQFFIVHEDSTFLDGNYAAFGHVTSGMDVVDKICDKVEVVDDNGTTLRENQPIIKKISVID